MDRLVDCLLRLLAFRGPKPDRSAYLRRRLLLRARVAMRANFDYEYVHDCGGVAFRLNHMPVGGEPRRARDAQHVDGRPMEPRSEVRCDACGRVLRDIRIDRVRHGQR